jgi:hypothetical protein
MYPLLLRFYRRMPGKNFNMGHYHWFSNVYLSFNVDLILFILT